MQSTSALLAPAFRDLDDTVDEIRGSALEAAENLLQRFVALLEDEPLASLLGASLPSTDFTTWWTDHQSNADGLGGSGAIAWPRDKYTRVAMQVAMCRAIAEGDIQLLDIVVEYFYFNGNLSSGVTLFAAKVLVPLCRDIRLLADQRPVPQVLQNLITAPRASGDKTLDSLIADACAKFQDPAPKSRAEATEKLWDAWERLKTTEVSGNKRVSIKVLLDRAATEATFRDYLEVEARLLTEIGNKFHIRHFETDKVSIQDAAHFEYLFHRLYALINLLLSRQPQR